jgi:hypothetical protein
VVAGASAFTSSSVFNSHARSPSLRIARRTNATARSVSGSPFSATPSPRHHANEEVADFLNRHAVIAIAAERPLPQRGHAFLPSEMLPQLRLVPANQPDRVVDRGR